MGMPAPVRNGFRSRLVVVVARSVRCAALYAQVDGARKEPRLTSGSGWSGGFPRGDGETGLEPGDYQNAIRFFSIALEKSARKVGRSTAAARRIISSGATRKRSRIAHKPFGWTLAVSMRLCCAGGVPRTQADGNGAFRRE